jgi:DNA-binding transcriptional MocR family regulator
MVSGSTIDADWLVSRMTGRGASDVRDGISSLIETGELPAGTQLPTIRDFARVAGISVGTIADSWSSLRDAGLIHTRRRGGSTVADRTSIAAPGSAGADGVAAGSSGAQVPAPFRGWAHIDLVQVNADVALQPALGEALLSSLDAPDLNAPGRDYMTPRLQAAVEADWPFPVEAWATAGGGTEALLLATSAAAPRGSVVAVDEPVVPGFLDTLADLGITAVGVAADEHGPTPDSLRQALELSPVAFVFQPGAPFGIDHTVSLERVAELAAVIAEHNERAAEGGHPQVWVIEDDSIGPLTTREVRSMGLLLPGQVLRIRSYCKAYGIDVRTSILGGSRALVQRSMQQRSHGVGSNSRILQNALAHLIGSAVVAQSVDRARGRYAERREALVAALATQGLRAHAGPESLVVWIEVPNEVDALVSLASQGISVGSGRKSFVTPPDQGLLRVAVTQLPDSAELIAEFARLVAQAARGSLREYFD